MNYRNYRVFLLMSFFVMGGVCHAAEHYVCTDDEGLTFELDAETRDLKFSSIKLDFQGRTVSGVRVVSASGSKYLLQQSDENNGIMFWSKGESALLEWGGNKATCRRHK